MNDDDTKPGLSPSLGASAPAPMRKVLPAAVPPSVAERQRSAFVKLAKHLGDLALDILSPVTNLRKLVDAGVRIVQAKAAQGEARAVRTLAHAAKLFAEAEATQQKAALTRAELRTDHLTPQRLDTDQVDAIDAAAARMTKALDLIRLRGGEVIVDADELRAIVSAQAAASPESVTSSIIDESRPNTGLVSWLNAEAPSIITPGASCVVVKCGRGHNVAELAARGYDAIGIDDSPSVIGEARDLHPDFADRFEIATLQSLPRALLRRSALVVACHVLDHVPPNHRLECARKLQELMRPHGCLLAIALGRVDGESQASHAPYSLTREELLEPMDVLGLRPIRGLDDYLDEDAPYQRILRGAFRRR